MKLLSKQQANSSFKDKIGEEVAQTAYLEKTLKKLQDRINTENDKFELKLQEQRKVYGEEKIALQADLRVLEGVLKGLREERRLLMVPIDCLRKDAEDFAHEANRRLVLLDDRQTEQEELTNRLVEKIDKEKEREKINNEWEISLKVRQIGIDAESEQVSSGHTKLNQQMKEFMVEVETKTRELSTKEETLEIEKKRAQEYFDTRKEELDNRERALIDRREAYEREFKRLNKLK